jgi:endonuclease/exonuclease/phosphatase (EEP) superfamily protein YafD
LSVRFALRSVSACGRVLGTRYGRRACLVSYHAALMSARRTIRAGVGAFAGLLTGLTVVGWLGGVWWVFDIASNFRVQYAVLLVPITIAAALLHRRAATVVSLMALIANLTVILPLYTSKPAAPLGPDRLNVMSFNVLHSNRHLDLVLEAVRASGADVVFLHEGTRTLEQAVEGANLPYRMVSAGRPGDKFYTVALVPEDADTHILDIVSPGILVTLPLGSGEVEVLGIHPPSPISVERSADRDQELRYVAKWAATQPLPVVVTGDFNASTWSHGFSLISGGLVNSQLGFGVQASWPAQFRAMSVPIDHLLYSPELTVVDRHLGPSSLGSDHFPLYVTLAWASK